jgi:hypothetical protein
MSKQPFHDYMEKCQYCGKYMTAEQVESHKCDFPFKDVKEIPIMYHSEVQNEKGETIIIARGFDGILYRLRLCKNPIRRNFTDDDTRRRLDRTPGDDI